MKLNEAAKTFETNAEFTSQDFTIGDVSVVIEILRNKLYRHKVRTLVQEYISNARDATREVNGKEKIQITLPTMYTPTFKVRDFGPGISPDRMYNVFIKYASSTKRKDNVQTGGFGIGAKSAWSYTESFTIVTHIDGVQRTYIAHIGANNNGRLDFLGEEKSDQANGTEIQIPVSPKDVHEFNSAAYRAVYFWKESERPVFVNAQKESRYAGDAYVAGEMLDNLEVNNKIPDYVVNTYESGIVVVIDGIPYVAGPSLIDKIESLTKLAKNVTGRLVLHLNNGDLEVSASREEIADSKQTTDSLTEIGKKANKLVNDKLTKAFAAAKSPFEYLTIFMSLKDSYKLESYRKCGQYTVSDRNAIESELFDSVKLERCEMPAPKFLLEKDNLNRNGRRGYYSKRALIQPQWFDKLYFADGTETALIMNYRIKALLKNIPTAIVFTKVEGKESQFDQVVADLGLKDLKSIPFVKPDRKAREALKIERTKQEFCIHDCSRYSNKARYITLENNIQKWLWIPKEEFSVSKHTELSHYLSNRGLMICALSADAIRRVKGDVNFSPLADYLKTFKPNQKDLNSIKIAVARNAETMKHLGKLTGLKNKMILNMIQEYKDMGTTSIQMPAEIVQLIGTVKEIEDFKAADKALTTELNTRYPLLDVIAMPGHNSKLLDEIVTYMNAK